MITNNFQIPDMQLFRTDSAHYSGSNHKASGREGNFSAEPGGFSSLVTDALQQVSDMQISADNLFEKMLTHPDEVQPHEVSIAMSRAELGLNMSWAIVDRAVKAYNNIAAMR